MSKSKAHRRSSPSSVAGFSNSTPTMAYATRESLKACNAVFANPLSNIPQSVVPKGKHIFVECIVSTTTTGI
jgi:hypothetical protein